MQKTEDFIVNLVRYYGAFHNKIAVILPIEGGNGEVVQASMAVRRDLDWISVLAYNDRLTDDQVIEHESMARALDAAVSAAGYGQLGGLDSLHTFSALET